MRKGTRWEVVYAICAVACVWIDFGLVLVATLLVINFASSRIVFGMLR